MRAEYAKTHIVQVEVPTIDKDVPLRRRREACTQPSCIRPGSFEVSFTSLENDVEVFLNVFVEFLLGG